MVLCTLSFSLFFCVIESTYISCRYANASTCNHRYIPNHPAIVIDIPRPSDEEAKKSLGILQSVRKKRADEAASGLVF